METRVRTHVRTDPSVGGARRLLRARWREAGVALLLLGGLIAGCAAQHPKATIAPPLDSPGRVSPAYDAALEPAAAVLSLVPDRADRLAVDDYAQIKLDLGFQDVTSASTSARRARYAAAAAAHAVKFGENLLAPVDTTLRERYGFGADDVAWQALFTGPGLSGYVLKLDDDVPAAGPKAAVAAKVGVLGRATYFPSTHILLAGATYSPATSWRSQSSLRDLVGQVAQSTYLQRSCVPFATAYGSGVEDQLAPASRADLAGLTPLSAFSLSYGRTLVTAQLGPLRDDAFDRARLAGHLPATSPDFGRGYASAVADPGGGRIGYTIVDPAVAAKLALEQRLPFAVCDQGGTSTPSSSASPSSDVANDASS